MKLVNRNLTTNFVHEIDKQESSDQFFLKKILVMKLMNRNLTTKIGREIIGHEISRPVGHQLDKTLK